MILSIVTPVLLALSLAAAPPEGEPERTVIRYSDAEERSAAISREFAPDEETCPNDVGAAVLVAPVAQGRRLVAYAFVTPRLCLARGVNEFGVTRQMHFIVDRMVRAAHRTPMTLTDDMTVDREATTAAMLAAAREVVGEDQIDELRLIGGDVRAVN